MEMHKIIRDEQKLQEFLNWLPDLKQNERFFVCLQARRKYLSSIKSKDKTQLKRFTANKGTLIDKLRQLECPIGSYHTKEGNIIPDEGIAVYITPNPRNMRTATFAAARELVTLIQKEDSVHDLNPQAEVLSCIHRAKGTSHFVHFDVDFDEVKDRQQQIDTIWQNISAEVGIKATSIVCTRGGCHVLIESSKVVPQHKQWYQHCQKSLIGCDQQGDLMLPIAGCCQGGFTPFLYHPS